MMRETRDKFMKTHKYALTDIGKVDTQVLPTMFEKVFTMGAEDENEMFLETLPVHTDLETLVEKGVYVTEKDGSEKVFKTLEDMPGLIMSKSTAGEFVSRNFQVRREGFQAIRDRSIYNGDELLAEWSMADIIEPESIVKILERMFPREIDMIGDSLNIAKQRVKMKDKNQDRGGSSS